jgi:hypothetical protein
MPIFPRGTSARRFLKGVALLAIFLCYVFLKKANLSFSTGDQGVYFYAGYLWSQGVIPYRDFFISHPPIQLLVPTLTILLTGVHLSILQLLPAFFGALSGVIILLLAWKPLGSLRAILASGLFLLSYGTLLSTLYYTGQNLTLLLLLLAILLFLKRFKFSSGLVLGIAQSVGIHILFPFIALSILQWRWGTQGLKKFLGGFFLSAGILHIVSSIVAGKNFWTMVYLYHLKKPDAPAALSSKFIVMSQMLQGHFLLVPLALLGCLFLWQERLLLVSGVMCITYLLYLSLISPIFPHYFAPLMPFLAILAAEGTYRLFLFLKKLWIQGQRTWVCGGTTLLILLAISASSRTITFYSYEQRALAFESAPQVAERIQRELTPDATLFGDFGVVPTVALLSGRRIAGNQVDSSVMRFASGLYDLPEIIQAIEEDHVKAILTRKEKDIAYYPPFQEYLKTHYRLVETYATPGRGVPIELWLHY